MAGFAFHHIHTDHLSGSNAITNSSGRLTELTDYYPYGSIRFDDVHHTFNEQRKFTGHEYDQDTEFSYMEARYYDGSIGRFRSIDPVFLATGNDQLIKEKTGQEMYQFLSDPQLLNSYSYVRNNPLKNVDKNGEYLESAIDIGFMAYDTFKIVQALSRGESTAPHVQALALDTVGLALPGVTGLGMVSRITGKVGNAYDAFRGIQSVESVLRDSAKIADKIADGHGYAKHIDNVKGGEFGSIIKTREQYSTYIKSVLDNPSEIRQLSGGRTAFYDDRLGGIVVHNPKSVDAGTAFKPDPKVHGYKTNRDYFRKGLK